MSKDFEIKGEDKAKKTKTFIDIKESDGKYKAHLTDVIDGVRQPKRIAFLDINGTPPNAFMVVRAPLREVNDDGSFKTRPRMRDDKYLDGSGKEVDTEEKAALEYVYKTIKGEPGKLVYGQVATINVQNTKKDKTPTAQTLMAVKLFSDDEALAAERIAFGLTKLEKDDDQYQVVRTQLNELRKSQGTYQNFFIVKGGDALKALGFEIRVQEKSSEPTPS